MILISAWDYLFESNKAINYEVTRKTEMLAKSFEDEDENYLTKFEHGSFLDIFNYLQKKKRLAVLETCKINFDLIDGITTHEQFTGHVLRVNLFSQIFRYLSLCNVNEYFDCILFKHHTAWIDKDIQKGIYRYFSRTQDGICRSFSIFDLLNIAYPHLTDINLLRIKLIELIRVNYAENQWSTYQQARIRNNLDFFETLTGNMKQTFPSTYKLTKTYLPILKQLIVNESSHYPLFDYSFNEESIVYTSSRYLSEVVKIDWSTVSKAIRLFAIIGLVKKISPHHNKFPASLLKQGLRIKSSTEERILIGSKKKVNKPINLPLVTFYFTPYFSSDLLLQCEETSKKLLQNNITNIKGITEVNIMSVFGKEFTETIFIDNKIVQKKLSP